MADLPEVQQPVNPFEDDTAQEPELVNVFDTDAMPDSDANRRQVVATEATAIALEDGEDPLTAYEQVKGSDNIDDFDTLMVKRAVDLGKDVTNEAIERLIRDDPNTAINISPFVKDIEEELTGKFDREKSVLASYRAQVDAMEGAESLSHIERDNVATMKYINREMAGIMDGIGGLEKAGEFAALMFIPNISLTVGRVASDVHGDSTIGKAFDSASFLKEQNKVFRSLPPEQRIKMFDRYKKSVMEHTDNEYKQAEILFSLTGGISDTSIGFTQGMDKVDAAFLGLPVASWAGKLLKFNRTNNIVRSTAEANALDSASALANIAGTTEEGARRLGVPQVDALSSVNPMTDSLETILEGSPPQISHMVRDRWSQLDANNALSSNVLNEGVGLTEAEKQAAVAARVAQLTDRAGMQDVVGRIDGNNMVLSYNKVDDEGNVISETITNRFTIDEMTGSFVDKELGFVAAAGRSSVISPNTVFKNDRESLVNAFERITFQSNKVRKYLNDNINLVTKGLSSKEIDNVGKVLAKGDHESRTFSWSELTQQGVGGIRLTDKEYTSYATARKIMDDLHLFKNKQMREEWESLGIKQIGTTADGARYGKSYETSQAGKAAYLNDVDDTGVFIQNPISRRHNTYMEKLDAQTLDDYYSAGYQLVKSNKDVNSLFKAGSTNTRYALVKSDEVTALPETLLQYRQGYMPRAYKDANYFVKEQQFANVNGVNTAVGMKTLRYFDNVDEAEKYRETLVARGGNSDDLKVLGDREVDAAEGGGDIVNQWGGLYSGARGDEAIKFGPDGQDANFVDPLEAMQGYIDHVASRLPMSEYRHGIERRWMLSAQEAGIIRPGTTPSFQSAKGLIESSNAPIGTKQKLIAAHEQISYMNRVPTLGEQTWQGVVRSIGDSLARMDNSFGKKFSKYLYRLDHSNPVAALKSGTFHLTLGLFNVSQLFVQGLGATIAASIHPTAFAKGMRHIPKFSTLDNIVDPRAKKVAIEMLARTDSDLAEAYTAWTKSGLFESAVAANSDAYNMYKGLPATKGAIGKVLEGGKIPFKMGELFLSRTAFLTAFNRWKSINPNKVLDDVAIKAIVSKTEDFKLHMSQANKASFQKGIMSVPTQFLAVQGRFAEAVLGSTFTKADKSKLILGQLALFGSAGVPFLDNVLVEALDATGLKVDDFSPETVTGLRRGMMGLVFNEGFGLDAVVSSRVGFGAGWSELWTDFTTQSKSEAWKIVLGPTGGQADRGLTVFQDIANMGKTIWSWDDAPEGAVAHSAQVMAESLAKMPSSTRNLMKALYLSKSDAYKGKNGDVIMSNVGARTKDLVVQALGFQSQKVSDYYEALADSRKSSEMKKAAADQMMRLYEMAWNTADTEEEEHRAIQMTAYAITSTFKNPQDQRFIWDTVNKRLKNPQDPIGKLHMDNLRLWQSEFENRANQLNPLIKAKQAELSGTDKADKIR